MIFADTSSATAIAHGIMIGAGFIGPTIGIGLVGASYLGAVGRNPEASKFLGQALVFGGLIEVTCAASIPSAAFSLAILTV